MLSQPTLAARTPPRLTELAHGGGCGCKLSPAVLRELLDGQMAASGIGALLVGNGESDDAAVWALEGDDANGRCIVATTDFFMPVVDDPRDFGCIAATNAISDIYAMGARPLFALAILGMPLGKVDTGTVREILAGGSDAARAAGIVIAGGHSIDSAEPIYGLAVIGEVARARLKTNAGARPGDALILTKPLGVGIYSAALKRGDLQPRDYAELIASTTRLNDVGALLGESTEIHAVTDVTGFGLAGHALEMARASGAVLEIDAGAVPLLPRVEEWARAGKVTGASARNWESGADRLDCSPDMPRWRRDLLTDPQTSGGLLVAVAHGAGQDTLAMVRDQGFAQAAIVGRVVEGAARVVLRNSDRPG